MPAHPTSYLVLASQRCGSTLSAPDPSADEHSDEWVRRYRDDARRLGLPE